MDADKTYTIYHDIANVLEHVINGLKTNNSAEIKEWSNHIVHNSSIFRDKHSIRTSILVYALSKIFEAHGAEETWKLFWKNISRVLEKALNYCNTLQIKEFEWKLKELTALVGNADKKFGEYIQYVLDKARIKKAWKIYEHGLSLGTVAQLLGVNKWEAMNYFGQTKTSDYPDFITENVRKRYETVKEVFK